jgi:hypothetical protein
MAPHRTVPTAALTRKEDWGTTDNEHVQDLLFKVAGIFLGIATLVVAYFHYRHPRSSRSDEEQPEPAEASSHSKLLYQAVLDTYPNIC